MLSLAKRLLYKVGSIGYPWYENAIGGMWEEIGRLQFDFLVAEGLEPTDSLLDVGCGSLRGGLHFIRYLERGHYCGVDRDRELLLAGSKLVKDKRLTEKEPRLVQMGDFSFQSLGSRFDYALAQSVFTHLSLNEIIRCLVGIDAVLEPGARFYATFFENAEGKANLRSVTHPTIDRQPLRTHFDSDPYHYDVSTFQWACEGLGLTPRYIGEWDHPRNQMMIVFNKS